MVRYLPLIVKNSWRNRRRTVLTAMSIAASLCLLGVLLAMYHALYFSEASPAQARRLIARNRVSLAFTMPGYYLQQIRQVPGVEEVARSQWFGGVYKDSRDPTNMFARFAVDAAKFFTIRQEMMVPPGEKQAFLAERSATMIGKPLAEKLKVRVGDRMTLQGDIFPVTLDFTVRAIFEAPQDDEIMYFHWEYLEESLSEGRRSQVGTFNILAASADDVPRIARAVDDMFRNSPVETKTESERAFLLSFVSFLGNVKVFLLSICAALTFTILLVSANTMAMSVRERIREIAILKTLGFTPGAVMGIVVGEAVVIALIGGALGLLLASGACGVVRSAPAFVDDFKRLTIPMPVAMLSLGIAALVGVISSVVPAWNASRAPIIDAIRNAG